MRKLFKIIISIVLSCVIFCGFNIVSFSLGFETESETKYLLSKENVTLACKNVFDNSLSFAQRYALCKRIENNVSLISESGLNEAERRDVADILAEYERLHEAMITGEEFVPSDFLSDVVNGREEARAKALSQQCLKSGIKIVERIPLFETKSIEKSKDQIQAEVFEWSFFIYEYNGNKSIFGMGFDHKMTFSKENGCLILTCDEYDDVMLSGAVAHNNYDEETKISGVGSDDGVAEIQSAYTPTATSYCYSPKDAVEFSYANAVEMNVESGCANFVKACLADGGLPVVSTWSRATVMQADLLNYGVVKSTPSYGDVVFYKWFADTYWHHAAICVGYDTGTGLPVVNAVNNLAINAPWTMAAYATNVVSPTHYGDVNFDLQVTTEDSRLILQAAAGLVTLTSAQNALADVNHDGKVNTTDSKIILQYAAV